MTTVTNLVCSKCGTVYAPKENQVMCKENHTNRLDILYDYERVKETLTKEALKRRNPKGIWRYEELMPVDKRYGVTLGEGGTPLIKAARLGEKLGLSNLYLKDDTRNPTGSFKDRAMAVGVAKAVEKGVRSVVTASSGNAAAALSAYSAKAGLECVAFVLDTASSGKLAQLSLYGAKIIRVRGIESGEDPTVKMMLETVRRKNWYPCPSFGPFNPYQVEGPKTISYELSEQFNWSVQDWVLVPTGSTCLLTGVWKGYRDFQEIGFIDEIPRLVPVQPAGNSPFVRAVKNKLTFEDIRAEPHPSTIASGLSDPFPWDGDAALKAVNESGGTAVSVDDKLIAQAVRDLAKYEGILAEPSGAAALAGLVQMLEDKAIDKNDRVVVLVTGSGLKDVNFLSSLMDELPPTIDANPEQLDKILRN